MFEKLADFRRKDSLAAKMRARRFEFFAQLLSSVPKPIRILDVGGTQTFWEMMGYTDEHQVTITVLNIKLPEVRYANFIGVEGNALNMAQFGDKEFEVVFSNSVIEHVGNFNDQERMAQEVMRIGKRYFVQTPNYYFPIEPHVLLPAYHWLPKSVRIYLTRHFKLGWRDKVTDYEKAKGLIERTRLLKKKEFVSLFPGALLYDEKILGMVKSFVAYAGW